MKMHPEVAQRKFAREVATLKDQEALLRSRGIWLQTCEYPVVRLVFVPHDSAVVILQTGQIQLPLDAFQLAARAFAVLVDLSNFDQDPPAVTFVDAWSDRKLGRHELPVANIRFNDQLMNVIVDNHPGTQLPFLCLRGTREYHLHPEHTGDDWCLYRQQMNLFSLVDQIWRSAVLSARPAVVIQLNQWLLPQV